jgi:hypothetical protein
MEHGERDKDAMPLGSLTAHMFRYANANFIVDVAPSRRAWWWGSERHNVITPKDNSMAR